MKFPRLALFLAAVSVVAVHVHADDDNGGSDADSDQNKRQPTEIPDFSHLDEYIYVPHTNLNYGYRFSTGPRVNFSGKATVTPEMANDLRSQVSGSSTSEGVTDHTSPNIDRSYHDGSVGADQRTTAIGLNDGNSPVNTGTNGADGKTNVWGYDSASQITSEDFIQFHEYQDTTAQGSPSYSEKSRGNVGLEAYVAYDWRKLSNKLEVKLFAGLSLNDLDAATMAVVNSTLSTTTDTYSLYGATPPARDGGIPVGQSVLISDAPIASSTVATDGGDDLTEHFKLHGAYATFRFGPEADYNFNSRWKLSLSLGPTLTYAGTTLQSDAVFVPPTGNQIVDEVTSTTNRLLYGGYVDVTLNYLINDKSGFYLGGFDQMSTGYTQSEGQPGNDFKAKVDFNSEKGLRSGMSIKF